MQNETKVTITAKDAAPFMRPLLAKMYIAIDEYGRHIDGTPEMSDLFNMPPRPFLKAKERSTK